MKTRKTLVLAITCIILAILMVIPVSACYLSFTGINVRTQTYRYSTGELLSTTYSWGSDDHPYYTVTNYYYNYAYHTGSLPKTAVYEYPGTPPYVIDLMVDRKYVYTNYQATYAGLLPCSIR